jgi:glutathione synthase/RimK-type ligase-like ATP-grasp enzyme
MGFIYSHNYFSRGAKELSAKLGWRRIKHQGSKFRGNYKPWILNWGAETLPDILLNCKVINTPEAIEKTTNKLNFFLLMYETGNEDLIPWWSAFKKDAKERMKEEKCTIVCRRVLRGHGGEGITVCERADQLVDAPLYVQYIPKKFEYRIHVFNGEVIDAQEKRRDREVPDDEVDWRIRNHDNGFIYARQELEVPDAVMKAAVTAINSTDLHFGAADIIYNEKQSRAYVLEINTAPGLEGTTIERYADAI